jgi:hypothetical protein
MAGQRRADDHQAAHRSSPPSCGAIVKWKDDLSDMTAIGKLKSVLKPERSDRICQVLRLTNTLSMLAIPEFSSDWSRYE